MIDVHAHLHNPEISDQIDAVVSRFVNAGGEFIINSGVDLESNQIVLDQSRKFKEVLPTVGLHPEITVPGSEIHRSSITTDWIEKNIQQLHALLSSHNNIVAIGECGLDYYWVKKERLSDQDMDHIFCQQKVLFSRQIELAREFDLPLVIHCRDEFGDKQCEEEILELLVKVGNSRIKGIFHSYTGSLHYLEDILALGFHVSFNGIITYKTADNVRKLMDAVPDDRLLIESDSPFLVPQKRRSEGIKVGEPVFVDEVVEYIAKRKGIKVKSLWNIVRENVYRIFDL